MGEPVYWLTTDQVKKHYKFDPEPFVEAVQAGDYFIKSKLQNDMTRLWLYNDVENVSFLIKKKGLPYWAGGRKLTIREQCFRFARRALGYPD